MHEQLRKIRAELERASAAPAYAPIIKMQAAERAIVHAVDLLAELVARVETLEGAQHGKS